MGRRIVAEPAGSPRRSGAAKSGAAAVILGALALLLGSSLRPAERGDDAAHDDNEARRRRWRATMQRLQKMPAVKAEPTPPPPLHPAVADVLTLGYKQARETYPRFDGWLRGAGRGKASVLAERWPDIGAALQRSLSARAHDLFATPKPTPKPRPKLPQHYPHRIRRKVQPLVLEMPVPVMPASEAKRCPSVLADATRGLPAKRFVYLIQGPSRPATPCVGPDRCYPTEDSTRDVIWLTYRQRSAVAGDLFLPTKWWAEGRNALVREAVKRASRMRDGGYLYYILTDDDAFPVPRPIDSENSGMKWDDAIPDDGWRRWEAWLSFAEPAFGWIGWYPPHTSPVNRPSSLFWNADHATTAYHREAVPFLLPFVRTFDPVSWLYCQWLVDMLGGWLYNRAKHMVSSLSLNNTEHRHYAEPDANESRSRLPTGGRGKYREQNWEVPARFMWHSLRPAGQRVLCPTYTEKNPSIARGRARLKKTLTYVVPQVVWRRLWNANSTMAKASAKFHALPQVAQLLRYLRCKDHQREKEGWNGTFTQLDTVFHTSNGRRRKPKSQPLSDVWRDRPPQPESCDPEWRLPSWDEPQSEWSYPWNHTADPVEENEPEVI